MDDFYCDEVLSGRTPVEVVAESETVFAFRHTRPAWSVHIVVIPKVHVPSLVDLGEAGEEILLDIVAMARTVAAAVLAEHGAAKVVTNLGEFQDSKHLHFHVLSGEPLT
ncbi:HIT family protein [Streptomyces sp. NPDC056549]|uniref:HIT family protein n=1 Tax=Streptomyces sp. NPDC056549 TaxID=3345864 RepID=UPI0036B38366